MKTAFRFTFEPDWRPAPLAYWVHLPVASGAFEPPAPNPVPHLGYPFLWVAFDRHELVFSAPAQLEHCIDVLSCRPLPTTRQLSLKRGTGAGPNGHWLSRLPASLKAPRKRAKLVQALREVRAVAVRSPTDFELGLG